MVLQSLQNTCILDENYAKMFGIIAVVCFLSYLSAIHCQEQAEHRNFQYNSEIDPLTGRYNFAYDTGNDNDIAHSLHMQYQDADGIVRGRYGYTDPRGKLRMVEYEAGPNGFIARGDVGPDMSLHDNAPVQSNEKPLSSYREGDFLLDPAPVQMAGWDPERDPLGQSIGEGDSSAFTETSVNEKESEIPETYLSPFDRSLFPTLNITSPLISYEPESSGYDERYPRLSISTGGAIDNSNSVSESDKSAEENQSDNDQNNNTLNINTIDVNPDEIRTADGSGHVRRSADSQSSTSENVQNQPSRSQPVKVTTSDGRRLFYRDSHSMEPHEHYYFRPTHDHDSEIRYYRPRQTHDHDAERTYYRTYRPRQTHDHDAERRYYRTYYRPRQNHDHDAERRYYRYRQNYDRDSARYNYYQGRVWRDGRLLFIDNHSREPHAHSSEPYQHHIDHQHSEHKDVHLPARYRNSDYPATAKPRQLQYIPSDKYHDKQYYWTYS